MGFGLNQIVGADNTGGANVLYAQWDPVPVDYKIMHYAERTDSETADTDITHDGKKYKLVDSVTLQADTDSQAVANADAPAGYEADWTATAGYTGNSGNTVANETVTGTVKADGTLVLYVLYKPIAYHVTYEYRGTVPAGVSPTAAQLATYDTADYYVGQTVAIKPKATAPAGYTFNGWNTEKITVTGDTFVMPARDAKLFGSFSPNTNTQYTIIHYQECLDQSATGAGIKTVNGTKYEVITGQQYTKTGTTDQNGTAQSKHFTGLEFDATDTQANIPAGSGITYTADGDEGTLTGKIAGDGSLTLEFFYKRLSYTITYRYEGKVPSDANPTAAALESAPYKQENVKYGAEVTRQAEGSADGYTFIGWTSMQVSPDTSGKFTMPDSNVEFVGRFSANGGTKYKIYHFVEQGATPDPSSSITDTVTVEGVTKTYELPTGHAHGSHIIESAGVTDEETFATAQSYTGFEVNWKAAVNSQNYNQNNQIDTAAGKVSGTIAGDGSLILAIYYDRLSYPVDYEYYGTIPAGFDVNQPATVDHKFGFEVTVADKPTVPGYTFVGWEAPADVTVTDNKFVMPSKEVDLRGYFEAAASPYKVEHYLENDNSEDSSVATNYTLQTTDTETITDKKTGEHVTAVPKAGGAYAGFSVETTLSALEGNVTGYDAATGQGTQLVLKVYYKRNINTVTYRYGTTPKPPAVTPDLPSPNPSNHKMGTRVTLAADPTAPVGYRFDGWKGSILDDPAGEFDGTTFKMPNRAVVLIGNFVPVPSAYKVEHYWQTEDGTGYETTPHETEQLTANTGTDVTAAKSWPGMTYNDTASAATKKGTVTGYDGTTGDELVLKLYYDRKSYDVTYQYKQTVDGASALPPKETYLFGKQDIVPAADATAPGYTFNGWYLLNEQDITHEEDADGNVTKMTMPARNVLLEGEFIADTSPYLVQHFKQKVDGTYDATPDEKEEFKDKKTGEEATAQEKTYKGFTLDAQAEGTVRKGIVTGFNKDTGEGKELVLKLYYERNENVLTYGYNGDKGVVPATASTLPPEVSYRYEEEVTAEAKATAPGYTFTGWQLRDESEIQAEKDADGNVISLIMPDRHAYLEGWFTPNEDTPYEVHFFYMKDNGQYSTTPDSKDKRTGTTDTRVETTQKDRQPDAAHEGQDYVYDPDANNIPSGVVDGNGKLVLKVYFKKSFTVRYLRGTQGTFTEDEADATKFEKLDYGTDTPEYAGEQDKSGDPTGNAGYTFGGWTPTVAKTVTKSVDYVAQWSANKDTKYKVEYYYQKDGKYPGKADSSVTRSGETDTTAKVTEEDKTPSDAAYVLDEAAKNVFSGKITGNGKLVLKVYFKEQFSVVYTDGADGSVFEDQSTDGLDYGAATPAYKDAESGSSKPSRPGYVFDGWKDEDGKAPSKKVKGSARYTAQWSPCEPAEHDPPVKKVVKGDTPPQRDTFTFTLTAKGNTAGMDENPMPEGSSGQQKKVSLKAGEEYEFGIISFTKPGTYTYEIREEDTHLANYTYDRSVYRITYTVVQEGNKLVAERYMEKDGKNVDIAVFEFDNIYRKPADPDEKEYFPEPEPDKPVTPRYTVHIAGIKSWIDDGYKAGTRPEAVTIRLYADGKEVAQKTLSLATAGTTNADIWTYDFGEMDMYKAGVPITYTLVEDATDGYKSTVTSEYKKVEDPKGSTLIFSLVNTAEGHVNRRAARATGDESATALWGLIVAAGMVLRGVWFAVMNKHRRDERG